MAAEVESMVWAGAKPWHGLGNEMTEEGKRDPQRLIVEAGLDWEVSKQKLYCEGKEVEEFKAVVRSTDQKVLGVVKNRFEPLQNKNQVSFCQDFVEEGFMEYHTAGSLKGGKVVWVLAKLLKLDAAVIAKGDPVELYLLLSGAHDGSLAQRVGFTPVRVVCANTLRMSHDNEASKLIRIKHTARIAERLDQMKEVMNVVKGEFEATVEQYRFLASKDYNQEDILKYVEVVFGFPKDEEGELSTRAKHLTESVLESVEQTLGHSWWTAYNGVTRYLNHEAGRSSDTRLSSLWFGPNANVSQKALDTAVEFAEVA